jgi:hypothetical protein
VEQLMAVAVVLFSFVTTTAAFAVEVVMKTEQAFEKTVDNVVVLSGMCDCRQGYRTVFNNFFTR